MLNILARLCAFRPFRLATASLALLLLAGCGTPQRLNIPVWEEAPLPEAVEIPHGQGRIWQVDFPGQEPSYLFGTIHVSDPRVFNLPKAAEEAFAKAHIAAFEAANDDNPEDSVVKTYFELPKDTDLEEVIGSETYDRMMGLFLFQVLKFERLDRMQPWVIWMLVGGQEITVDVRQQKDKPVLDDWLQTRAADDGKEVVALETAIQQWSIFSDMPMEDQVSMLRSAIDHYNGPRTKVERIRLYLDGDLAVRQALWDRFLSSMDPAVAQRFNERLVTGRNRSMTERLVALFARGSTFVAVGAMHLPGEEGILSLLERRGYTVTRLQ